MDKNTGQYPVKIPMIIVYLYNMTGLDIRHTLAQNIKNRRKELGITQEKLAELANISAPYMNDIERCQTWVSDKTLAKLATALLLDVSMLFDFQNSADSCRNQKENFIHFQSKKKKLMEYISKSLDAIYLKARE